MKIGLVGPSNQQNSLPFNAERTINLYAIADPKGKEVSSLYGTPGCILFATFGSGPQRGGFSAANGRVFGVSGSSFYELLSDGTASSKGTIDQSQGDITFAENGIQLALCDGQSLYIFNYTTGIFQKIVTVGLPSALTVTFASGYFIVNQVNSGRFSVSKLYDGLLWDSLDFATAESSPDRLLRVLNVSGQLWLFGERTTEIWGANGSSFFPFSRVNGAEMDVGIVGSYAVTASDNTAFWIGRDKQGSGIVYRADGFTPQRISNESIEKRLQEAPNPNDLKCYSYQEQGHNFVVITGGGMETAIVYDINTQLFHERAFLNEDGNYELPLATDCIFAFNKQLTFDRNSAKIYEQKLSYYSDNGEEIPRDRIFTHISDENKWIKLKNLSVYFASGVGTQTGLGVDPQASLSFSNDGGKTFGMQRLQSMGRVGEYQKVVQWDRLGISKIRTFRIRVTDPVEVTIIGAYLNV